jgi:hypothetical protein
MQTRFLTLLFAVIAFGSWAVPALAQESSHELLRYTDDVKNHEGRKAMLRRPPLTPDELVAAMSSSEGYWYPGVLSLGLGWFEGLAKIRSEGRVGYIGRDGKIAIAAKFDEGGRFSEGLARVLIKGKWGFIGRTGRVVISPIFECAATFSEGRALVKIGSKWGFINKKGRIVIRPRFDGAESFSEGLAAVQIYQSKYKTGYIDRSGRWILRPTFDGGSSFHEGLAIVGRNIGYNNGVVVESHVINPTGRRLFEHASWWQSSYSEGRLEVANKRQLFGFLDRNGRLVIPYEFDHANRFSEGLAVVSIDGKRVYIDNMGNVVLRPEAECWGDFSSGRAGCESLGKWGFIDRTGKFAVQPKYDWVAKFQGELAAVFVGEKVGYINRAGQHVWEPTE